MAHFSTRIHQIFLATGAFLAWLAVIAQLYLIILHRVSGVVMTLIKFFSFFTILTNIIVALTLTILCVAPLSRWGRFLSQAKTVTAVTVYIVVVGLVYNLVLRQLWDPQGLQRLVDELLHTVNPLFFLIYWIFCASKGDLQWSDAFPWLIYPGLYLVYLLARGALSGEYPYPFVDVNNLGYAQVLTNGLLLCGVFMFFSLLFIALSKWRFKHRN